MTGQDLTTTAIITLENFLADNIQFNDFDDAIRYINLVLSEKSDRNILDYLNRQIKTKEQVFEYFVGKINNLPEDSMKILKKTLYKLDSESLNRLYFKNRILEFVDDLWGKETITNLIQFKYSESPEEAMIEPLKDFRETIIDFCYTDIIFDDRFKRVVKDERKNIIASDTDSVFINLNNYILKTTNDLGLDPDNEDQQMIVMNIFVNVITEALKITFNSLTRNMGLIKEYSPIINMKSEFLYKRIMSTRNKKQYAGLITAELGKLLNKPVLDIKGLSIRKTNVPKRLRKQFTTILTDDILDAKEIDLKRVINEFDNLGVEVEESLKRGELLYSLPKSIENFDTYKDPSSLEPVRGAMIWNALEPENQIVPPEKCNLIKLKGYDKNDPLLKAMEKTHPDKYNSIMRVVFNEGVDNPTIDISRFGLSVVSIPKSVETFPDYLRPLIDYRSMINNNMTNGYILLESLGIYCDEVATTKYKSNIIEI